MTRTVQAQVRCHARYARSERNPDRAARYKAATHELAAQLDLRARYSLRREYRLFRLADR